MKTTRLIDLEIDDFGTLAICAIRYCHGRQTYMPYLVQGIIRPHLRELSDKDLSVMIDDCDFQERMHLYGDERIDKPGWLKWKDELIAEKERRTDEETIHQYHERQKEVLKEMSIPVGRNVMDALRERKADE